MNRMHEQMLTYLFNRVPNQQVVIWDWHSREGDIFLTLVEELVDKHGVDINEIGSLIGMKNFSQRYRGLTRGRGAAEGIDGGVRHEGEDNGQGRRQGGVSPLRDAAEDEGEVG